MAGNSIGKLLVLTTFGESHGPAVGGVLDGFPARIKIDPEFIQSEINRRNPANYPSSTPRKEKDEIEILSGLLDNMSTGAPIAFLIRNTDHRTSDYEHLKNLYRPSHADFTWEQKFGIRDHRGGGRASARATVAWVAAGAFAKTLLAQHGITVKGFVSQIGPYQTPDGELSLQVIEYLEKLKTAGDTAGGVVTTTITGVPAGLGEPVFDKLHADLAKAVLSIPAVKGFETGSGFAAAAMTGSQHNDVFLKEKDGIHTKTNNSGGIQGGISNGMPIIFRTAFKPVSTLAMQQTTVDREGHEITFEGKGRHDVCVVPRAVVIVEAMAALVVSDHYIRAFH